MKFVPDAYTRYARIYPAFLVVLPLGVAVLAWVGIEPSGWKGLWALIVAAGGTALVSQVGRDAGKRKEAALFQRWGGKPTTRLLRHRDAPNQVLLKRRHEILGRLSGLELPSAEEEAEEPTKADEVYEACASFLRSKTRDTKRFNLVFDENCSYGFRRNLWGMKALGLVVASIGAAALVGLLVKSYLDSVPISPITIICGLINLALLAGWLVRFTPNWVVLAADAYGERLLEVSEQLE